MEYQGLIEALYWAKKNLDEPFDIRCDSKLIVEQTMGRWKIKEPRMKPLAALVKQLMLVVPRFTIKHIPREKNADADALCRKIMDSVAQLGERAALTEKLRCDNVIDASAVDQADGFAS
jgi:probable phosphoglycerate mutase